MKKKLFIELETDWVLSHRDDESLPIEVIKNTLSSLSALEFANDSLTEICVVFDDQTVQVSELEAKIKEVFSNKYPQDDFSQVLSLKVEDEAEIKQMEEKDEATEDKTEDDDASTVAELGRKLRRSLAMLTGEEIPDEEQSTSATDTAVQEVMNKINDLVGAQPFKALANEIVKIAPETKQRKLGSLIAFQSYLFSIGDGCGFTTYLNLLAQLLNATGVQRIKSKSPVIEEKLPEPHGMDWTKKVDDILDRCAGSDSIRVLGLDISECMNDMSNPQFRQLLQRIEKTSSSLIVVFRVPFVDREVLAKVESTLNDVHCIRTLEFPPMNESEIKCCAQRELEKYGYKVSSKAWDYFLKRIVEEKVDGRFYGLNTVKKVIVELIYKKMLDNASKQKPSDIIGKRDTMLLCSNAVDSELSGYEMLEKLVGNDNIKKSIEEIIAQIEFVVQNKTDDRPCIHMRFEGNPGTGKTTVARIIGKILKEKGILRLGNFYEYGGRDLCGRYVGETAPKTSSICRDAYGSVLFIDEAYSLYRGEGSGVDYGKEAIDTLIAEMENHRNDLVVIMAGYKDDMNTLMKGNLGLASRMPYIIEFPNFSREQLYEIFVSMVKSKFKYDEKLFDVAKDYFLKLSDEIINSKEFSNARFVRNLFERTWAKASLRCQLDKHAAVILTANDFEMASSEKEFKTIIPKKSRIGF